MDFFGIIRFSVVEISLLAVLLTAFIVQLYFYIRYFMGVIRHNKRVSKGIEQFRNDQPPVSVIICARDEEENLRKFLPFVLEQDYPDYEVIVINDGSTDHTDDYLSLMVKQYEKLRTTFVPGGATNVRHQKGWDLSTGYQSGKK